MTAYNHLEYMEQVATFCRDIAHSKIRPRFFKSTGLANLDGLIARLNSAYYPCLVAEDNSDERFTDNLSDNVLSLPFYSFFILLKANPGNDDEIFAARNNAKIIAKKVISRMANDGINSKFGLELLEYNSIRFLGVGPIGDSGYGVMASFTLKQHANCSYVKSDWLDE